MDSSLKKKLRALSLTLRHTLEGSPGQAGDLESRLNQMGVWKDRPPKPVEEMRLSAPDLAARRIVDAFLNYRQEAGISQKEALAEFVRESAYTWANRLFMLRCLESRALIDEVILQKRVYGGRSLVHHRFAQQNPSACVGEDDGLFSVLEEEFSRRATELPTVFDPQAPAVTLRPSVSALKRCIGLLSGSVPLNGQGEATDELFEAGDAPGWAYQFWNAEEKDRVFEKVRTEKGAKIEGADLIPATQLYTEPYMVKFLVQNSLGALWAGMYPETKLPYIWEYYVRDADRTPPVQPDPPAFERTKAPKPSADPWVRPNPKLCAEADIVAYARTMTAKAPGAEAGGFVDLRNQLLEASPKPVLAELTSLNQEICKAWDREWPARRPKLKKPAAELTFLDPACGSGHFLLEAFDLLYTMYEEEGILQNPEEICASILNHNLFGIDIDERAIQITVAALWMHALQRAPHLKPGLVTGLRDHLVAANISLPSGRAHLEEFLVKHPEDAELRPALQAVFRGLVDANQLGTLVRIEEPVEQELQRRKEEEDRRSETALRQSQTKLDFMAEQYVMTVAETRDYDAWKRDVLERLKEHFRQEGAVSDPVQGFFGRDASRGLALFELLACRYDVVAANPPYMGNGNMGAIVKSYCSTHYSSGKRDLYAAFIERCCQICRFDGYVGMITQQSWMFLRSFSDLRTRMLRQITIETLAHLGPGAFAEISGEAVNTVLFCVRNTSPNAGHRLAAFRLLGYKGPKEKKRLLSEMRTEGPRAVLSRPQQKRFLQIPQAPICYWMRERLFELLSGPTLSEVATFTDGAAVRSRFVRFHWESTGSRWTPYTKGGGYARWVGREYFVFDWEPNGKRFTRWLLDHYPADKLSLLLKPHRRDVQWITWTDVANGSMAGRLTERGFLIGHKGPAVTSEIVPLEILLGLMNSRLISTLLRAINPTLSFLYRDLMRAPYVVGEASMRAVVGEALALKRLTVARDPIERSFAVLDGSKQHSIVDDILDDIAQSEARSVRLNTLEAASEQLIFSQFGIEGDDLVSILDETGTPCGWFPLISGYITSFDGMSLNSEVRNLDHSGLSALRRRLGALYAAGPGAREVEDVDCEPADDEEMTNHLVGGSLPIPTESFLEELSQKLQIHPLSTYRLLAEMKTDEGLICLPEIRRLMEERVSITILRLLGHLWPTEVESGTSSPTWFMPEGLATLADGHPNQEIMRNLVKRMTATFGASSVGEFQKLLDISLDKWVKREFYARHVRQFRSRPVVWQVQTQASSSGEDPIFSCFLYYHRIAGAVPNLRTQYAGTLRTSFESELRTLEVLTQPTVDQSGRKKKLGFWIEELKEFQDALESIEVRGFFTPELQRYAIVDAIHSLTRCWLARLREVLRKVPLPAWQEKTEREDLHPEFSSWIAEAVEHVDRQCVAVAPDPPGLDIADEKLTPAALSESFRSRAPSMIRTALEAICREWQSQFDKTLVKPLRELIKAAEEEHKELEDNIENKLLRKSLKSKVKVLKSEIATLAAKSGALADEICDWRFPKAEEWVEWLATQPLYDEFASHDGRRSVPKTVADFVSQESQYAPDINDGVRVNIAPLQKAGILARDVLAAKDVDKAIADRAEWRADERRWCRQGVLPRPGWWPEVRVSATDAQDTVSSTAGI